MIAIGGWIPNLPPAQQTLVYATLEAIYSTGLPDVASLVANTVLTPIPEGPAGDAVKSRVLTYDNQLAPFAELALREILRAGTAVGWSASHRRAHALWALTSGGFV